MGRIISAFILLLLASPALPAKVELVKPLDVFRANLLPGEGHRIIAEHPTLNWYGAAYFPDSTYENWRQDTLEVVMKDGASYRAVYQYAMTPDARIVKLVGMVPTRDLERARSPRWAGAVILSLAFKERFQMKNVREVRVAAGAPKLLPPSHPSGAPAGK